MSRGKLELLGQVPVGFGAGEVDCTDIIPNYTNFKTTIENAKLVKI